MRKPSFRSGRVEAATSPLAARSGDALRGVASETRGKGAIIALAVGKLKLAGQPVHSRGLPLYCGWTRAMDAGSGEGRWHMRSRERSFWMWAEALELLQGGEQLRRRFFTLDGPQPVPCWEPAVDVYQNDDELRLLVALPGVGPRQVEVVLDDDGLLVRGERPMPARLSRAAIHRIEIPYGRFERRIPLPAGRYRLDQRFFADGCLMLVLHPS